jgi:hypothetical protein
MGFSECSTVGERPTAEKMSELAMMGSTGWDLGLAMVVAVNEMNHRCDSELYTIFYEDHRADGPVEWEGPFSRWMLQAGHGGSAGIAIQRTDGNNSNEAMEAIRDEYDKQVEIIRDMAGIFIVSGWHLDDKKQMVPNEEKPVVDEQHLQQQYRDTERYVRESFKPPERRGRLKLSFSHM